MAKYIKQEMPDLNGTGTTHAYYRMQTCRNMGFNEFVDRCTQHGGMQRSAIVGVMAHVAHELALHVAAGYTVTIDGLGTFGARLGVRPDVAADGFDPDEEHRNSRTLGVTGVRFHAHRALVSDVDRHCRLERGGTSRLLTSPFTPEQRVGLARSHMAAHTLMRTRDYAALTGLSAATASRELRRLSADPSSGIVARGRGSSKVYVLAKA